MIRIVTWMFIVEIFLKLGQRIHVPVTNLSQSWPKISPTASSSSSISSPSLPLLHIPLIPHPPSYAPPPPRAAKASLPASAHFKVKNDICEGEHSNIPATGRVSTESLCFFRAFSSNRSFLHHPTKCPESHMKWSFQVEAFWFDFGDSLISPFSSIAHVVFNLRCHSVRKLPPPPFIPHKRIPELFRLPHLGCETDLPWNISGLFLPWEITPTF